MCVFVVCLLCVCVVFSFQQKGQVKCQLPSTMLSCKFLCRVECQLPSKMPSTQECRGIEGIWQNLGSSRLSVLILIVLGVQLILQIPTFNPKKNFFSDEALPSFSLSLSYCSHKLKGNSTRKSKDFANCPLYLGISRAMQKKIPS